MHHMFGRLLNKPFFIRLLHWEYWPFHIVYLPVYVYWFWLSLKSRSFFFFNTANPTIRNGGFLLESKKEIYDLIPHQYYPATLFFKTGTILEDVLFFIKQSALEYPLICKPDIGMQGKAVRKVHNLKELSAYVHSANFDFLVQEYIAYEHEAGIFYYRYPDEENGVISGIVYKELLAVTGNGTDTIEQLLMREKRSILQLETLRIAYSADFYKVPEKGERLILVPYGNHVRGAKFIDASHLIDNELSGSLDKVCKQINGFYFGRLDIRYNNWEELKAGKNFSIIELNGAGSEPTHMYDPKHSIFYAWKEIIRHLDILSKISRMNRKKYDLPHMSISLGLQMFSANKKHVHLLDNFKG